YPSIAVDGKGKISVTWYDRREDPYNQIGRYYIAQSTDQGHTWTNAPVATQPTDFNYVMNTNGNFGIGEYTQVLSTPNYTIPVWTDGRDGTGNLRVYAAFIAAGSAAIERFSTVSQGIQLSRNYPNPFAASTNLRFTLATPAHARLFVTNIAGQHVASIFDGMAAAGEHDFSFDGSRLANGVYYLNLETDLGIARNAMTILR
ncbi:MAG TPA: FlgD immunoglobulin-like domain containing protein, partial [Candidatus Kapabacteria bacterium]|nr:FlgD immunoglobulin-like domain containing protein [Candidatus Kapabacteria bacterium]